MQTSGRATRPAVSAKNCVYIPKTPREIDIPKPEAMEMVRRPILIKFRILSLQKLHGISVARKTGNNYLVLQSAEIMPNTAWTIPIATVTRNASTVILAMVIISMA